VILQSEYIPLSFIHSLSTHLFSTVFPVFGAATGDIAFLPLAFILTVTAIKDGIEDYRRARLDEEVNSSAVTRLGSWRNVNQPADPRPFIQKLLGINPPGRITRGVRHLREKEAGEGMRVIPRRDTDDERYSASSTLSLNVGVGAAGRRLEDIQSVDEHSYPPDALSKRSRSSTLGSMFAPSAPIDDVGLHNAPPVASNDLSSPPQYALSTLSRSTLGVIDPQVPPRGVARWERTLWKKLEVGDIVLLHEDEQVPADVIILASSDPDGLCYLETKNLDGETNLKPRRACRATASIASEEDMERARFWIDSEGPHPNLYSYHAVLRYKDSTGQTGEEKAEALSINDLLLRGCTLRNTEWVIGLVAFTGPDTKIMLNGGDTPSKRSKIEKETNFNVVVNFIVLFIMCIVAAICGGVQEGKSDTSEGFFEQGSEPTNTPAINAIVTFVYVSNPMLSHAWTHSWASLTALV
jgi:phospholipid-translocating ATPase